MAKMRGLVLRNLHRAALATERGLDAVRRLLSGRRGGRPLRIAAYHGHGNEHEIWLRGRVLEDRGIRPSRDEDSKWRNAASAWRRFASREQPGARVRATCGGATAEYVTDEEGYFFAHLRPDGLPTDVRWHSVLLELVDGGVSASGPVLVPPASSRFGVISDVDDTVLVSGATNLLRMAQLTVLRNARSRLPFAGVASFYRALVDGPTGAEGNPIFYVSSSPWNLHDFLVDFLEFHRLPVGPLFLRDLGLDKDKFVKSRHAVHKLAEIAHLLEAHPHLPFVCLGDSGQADPEIYREAVERFPGRIRTIWIRDVVSGARDEEVHAVARDVERLGSEMLLVPDTVVAARQAVERGLVAASAVEEVAGGKARDEGEPTAGQRLLGMGE